MQSAINLTDFLIIGGGIVGLSIALELRRVYPDATISLLEKEKTCGEHASGLNSGVLHAGFYYTADSLKARFTREGNKALTEYCEKKNLRMNKCGKLVVARNEDDLIGLDELLRRAQRNKVDLHEVTETEALTLEPRAKTYKRALYSPTTSSVNPKEVLSSLTQDALAQNIHIHTSTRYLKHDKDFIYTNKGQYRAKYTINSAGLYADRIARQYGFSRNYRILPFKGLYLYSDEVSGTFKKHIYPVPNLQNPFLGVHSTLTVDGKMKIGPTALPALWREQYSHFKTFNLKEMTEIGVLQSSLWIHSNFNFRKLAFDELSKQSKFQMIRLASVLMKDLKPKNHFKWGKPGIRAQLVNLDTRQLEMDFVIQGDNRSMHVLNAVSPGFTCAFPFASYICEKISHHLKAA